MSNWDAVLDSARQGRLPTMFPADLRLPMVAPEDVGRTAARLLCAPPEQYGVHHIEGPAAYCAREVADAFSKALGRPVQPAVTPRDRWVDAFRELGFSPAAAASYTRMTGTVVDGAMEVPTDPARGIVTIDEYVSQLVRPAVKAV